MISDDDWVKCLRAGKKGAKQGSLFGTTVSFALFVSPHSLTIPSIVKVKKEEL